MKKASVLKDTPLAELTLRRYEKPFKLEDRELVKKLCLSIGLLQPGDSRDVIVDVFHALLNAKREKKELGSEEIKSMVIENRKNAKLALVGIASSNIRRQLKRLRDVFLVEKIKNKYRVTEYENLSTIFDEKIQKFLLQSVLTRINDYLNEADARFR